MVEEGFEKPTNIMGYTAAQTKALKETRSKDKATLLPLNPSTVKGIPFPLSMIFAKNLGLFSERKIRGIRGVQKVQSDGGGGN